MDNIPIQINDSQEAKDMVGMLYVRDEDNKLLYDLLEDGYSFRIVPVLKNDKLISISLLTETLKRL